VKRRLNSILPELIVGCLLTIVITCFFWRSENVKYGIVTSDGRGYYAFLPATFIQKDLSFKTTHAVESKEFNDMINAPYVIENDKGQTFNKCYPGVAVMELPFFLTALLIESTYSDHITGYSMLFLMIFQLGSIFYAILGLYFLRKYLELSMNDKRAALLSSLFIFIGTNLFFIVIFRTSFSHHFSFCLFAAFAYLVRKYFDSGKLKHILWIGIVLGLIALIRPVNVMIILAIPLILMDWNSIKLFFSRIFQLKNGHLFLSFVVCTIIFSLVFLLNYLQTGNIMNWSYHGEGFDFSSPHFWEELFSYRIGLFVHTPLLLLSLVGLYFLFKKSPQAVFFWLVYVVIVTYIVSCWWSWDFGGFYGNRVYIEHLVFFALPLAYFFQGFRWQKVAIAVASLFAIFMWTRAYQVLAEIIPNRFTQETFFRSMFRLSASDKNSFSFNIDAQPYGVLTKSQRLKQTESTPMEFGEMREFGLTATYILPKNHSHNRYYFKIKLNKTLAEDSDLKGVHLVLDWYDTLTNKRSYHTVPLYEYYKESRGEPKELLIYQEHYSNPKNELNKVNIYIWNQQKKRFTINRYEVIVEEYEPFDKKKD
jgi:hypothetical protein